MHGTCGERRKKKDGEEKNNNRKEQIVHDQITMTMSTRYAVRYTHGHDHTLLYYRRFLRRPFSSLHTLAADNILLIFFLSFCLSSFFRFYFCCCWLPTNRWPLTQFMMIVVRKYKLRLHFGLIENRNKKKTTNERDERTKKNNREMK